MDDGRAEHALIVQKVQNAWLKTVNENIWRNFSEFQKCI